MSRRWEVYVDCDRCLWSKEWRAGVTAKEMQRMVREHRAAVHKEEQR